MLSYGAVGGLVGVAVGCYLIRKWTSRQWGYFKSDKSLKRQVSRQWGYFKSDKRQVSRQWGYFKSDKSLKGQADKSLKE
jgi:hypothetical protein